MGGAAGADQDHCVIKSFKLKKAPAHIVAQLILIFYAEAHAQNRVFGTSDDAANMVWVQASCTDMVRIRRLIEAIESSDGTASHNATNDKELRGGHLGTAVDVSTRTPANAATMPKAIALQTSVTPAPPAEYVVPIRAPVDAPRTQHAHLFTLDLEAHCERMVHTGNTILLEGDVLLLCRKNGQPVRIEAHRVILNMNDRSFTAESNVPPGAR
jgi:hypothetical protein